MIIPTLKLSDITEKWKNAIKNSSEIDNYCNSKYQKPITIFVGMDMKNKPVDNDFPIVIIRPGVKIEGEDEVEFRYSISASWGIINENVTAVDNVKELDGIKECDELGQLIFEELSKINTNYPLSTVEYEINPIDYFPMIAGEMLIELTVTPTIGGTLTY